MSKQYKKIFSVMFAILIGAGIIFFAWKGSAVNYSANSLSVKNDAWRDSLSVVPQTDFLKTLSASRGSGVENTATTTADIISRELLINYTLAQKNMSTTTMSDTEATAIAQIAVSKINLPQSKQYEVANLNISNDNSSSSIATYMKEVGALTKAFTLSQTKNDIDVAFAVPKIVGVAKRESDIAQNIAHYERLIKGLIATRTPSSIAQPHLHLVQKYSNLQANIKPMADIFTDPLKGLAALAQYRKEFAEFTILASEYARYVPKNQ